MPSAHTSPYVDRNWVIYWDKLEVHKSAHHTNTRQRQANKLNACPYINGIYYLSPTCTYHCGLL